NAPGFAPFEATATVQIDAATRVDATLPVKGESTKVEVTEETPLLKTDRSDVSTTLSTQELGQLPILNRNLTFTMFVTPGTQINEWQHASSENPQGGYQIDANGQQFTSNGFLLDGTENNSSILNIAVINPNIDSLQEFKITTSDYDAQFGSVSGALLQATTKSGSNNFHGSAFEYLRNDYFNAKDWTSGQSLPLAGIRSALPAVGRLSKTKSFALPITREHDVAGPLRLPPPCPPLPSVRETCGPYWEIICAPMGIALLLPHARRVLNSCR